MANQSDDVILVYARIRPPTKKIKKNGLGKYKAMLNEDDEFDPKQNKNQSHLLQMIPPKDDRIGGYVDNTIESYQFSFNKIFDVDTKQDEIFNSMAVPIINNTLSGYNGTIFAYGQTGSGKTYTMTGGTSSYNERGIIPRTISYIFNKCNNNKEFNYKIKISYLEIYNDKGYDLLVEDDENTNNKLNDLPKIKLYEDQDGIITISNLNLLTISNEEEALNYLFIGDTNRMICSTPNNDQSSRSHCIFTIFIESTKINNNSGKIFKSKLNLVDLAGSERVYKSRLNGVILNESKYINCSLHFLEQVMISLYLKSNHIPYRNSMITLLLKDSLGGNCKTIMIATLSMQTKSIFESISTCQFSQRVALIKNVTKINTEIDPNIIINKLKLKIKQLKQELLCARNENNDNDSNMDINDEEKDECKQMIQYFIHKEDDADNDNDDDMLLSITDQRKIKYSFKCLREIIVYKPLKNDNNTNNNQSNTNITKYKSKIKELNQTIQERDHEINILVSMLKKNKNKNKNKTKKKKKSKQRDNDVESEDNTNDKQQINGIAEAGALSNEEAKRRNEEFKIFVQKSHLYTIIEENKNILANKFSEAKNLGKLVNETRNKMNKIKTKIQQIQITRAMNKLNVDNNGEQQINEKEFNNVIDDKENNFKKEIEEEKEFYKKYYLQLKNLKVEIEHMKCMLKKNRRQIQIDFENWWSENKNMKQKKNKNKVTKKIKIKKENKPQIDLSKPLITSWSSPTERILSPKSKQMLKIKKRKHKSMKVITGDHVADENIAEFYRLRKEILDNIQ